MKYQLLFCSLLLTIKICPSNQLVKKINNMTLEDAISSGSAQEEANVSTGPFSSLIEDWTLGFADHRQDRILRIPNTHGYYISNRVDTPPPPPKSGNIWSEEYPKPGKITNRPPPQYNNYQNQNSQYVAAAPSPPPNGSRKEVSETDLYLLGAIEKLVYRVDFMEKRLRKTEELVYMLSSGIRRNSEPCPKNFLRAGVNCYNFITKELDWKSASSACKEMGATLAEMESIEENQDVVTHIQANGHLKGKDFWTGGLNPGLLWIWSNSARPVATGTMSETQLLSNNTNIQNLPMNIKGNGRCLKLAYNPAVRTYAYMGHDCAIRQSYICEILDKSLSNDIKRISRKLNL